MAESTKYLLLARHLLVSVFLASVGIVRIGDAGVPAAPVQVTTNGGVHPTLSPDGIWAAYQGAVGIERIRLSDAKVETLFVGAAFEPDWSRTNGLLLIRNQSPPVGLLTVNPETKATQFITATGFDDGAVWSPLGDGIAAQGSNGLVFITYPGGVSSPIACLEPDQTGCSGEDPGWSPDGQWIAFYDGPVEKVSRLGGQAVNVTQPSQGGISPSWSPDGRWIAFVAYEGPDVSHLWVTDSRGSAYGIVQITEGSSIDGDPTWSPHSDAIFFHSDRSGRKEIWRVNFESAVPTQQITWGRLKALHR